MGQRQGCAVPLDALGLDPEDVLPLCVGDDLTDEDAFRGGIGVVVADPADPEIAGRRTPVDYLLRDTREVENFLNARAR